MGFGVCDFFQVLSAKALVPTGLVAVAGSKRVGSNIEPVAVVAVVTRVTRPTNVRLASLGDSIYNRYRYGMSAQCEGIRSVALSEIDRNLLERCLQRKSRAWEDFVDRFMGLVIHVVTHTAQARSVRLTAEDRDDLCAEVFLAVVRNDFALLRNFRGESSLATYLTVVSRRIVVKEMLARKTTARLGNNTTHPEVLQATPDSRPNAEQRVGNKDEVERLLASLRGTEAQVVRMYHLEGRSYREISSAVGMPENSIGPILSRARDKLRRAGVN